MWCFAAPPRVWKSTNEWGGVWWWWWWWRGGNDYSNFHTSDHKLTATNNFWEKIKLHVKATHTRNVFHFRCHFPKWLARWKKGMNDLSIRHSCSVEHKGQVWLSLESLTNGNNCRSFVDKKPWLGLNLLWVIAKCKQTELLESVKAGLSVDKCWQSERLFTRTRACSSFSCAEKQNLSMRCVFRPLCEYNLGKLARAGPAMEDRPQMEFNIAVMARESFSKCHSFHFSKLKFKTDLVGGPCSASPSLVKSMDVL